jgi:uncharacterized membrane protein
MIEFFNAHASEILSAIAGAIGGALISIPITIKVTRTSSVKGSSTTINQRGARAKGDMVGRDKISH